MLISSPVLALYDPNLETVIAADASSYSLGQSYIKSRQMEAGNQFHTSQGRCQLSATEQRYAQIEKEVLAFTWACERLSDYLLGLKFHIQTDHKPLVPLFSTKHLEEIPVRVQRFRMRMMRFEFTISHVRGTDLVTADALSRAPATNSTVTDGLLHQQGEAFINLTIENLPATEKHLEQIRKSQREDEACQPISKYCTSGWPDKRLVPTAVKPYLPMAGEFSVQQERPTNCHSSSNS